VIDWKPQRTPRTTANGSDAVKRVRPIFVEEADEIVVVTVYTYYFSL
jgi:hypothetical protein